MLARAFQSRTHIFSSKIIYHRLSELSSTQVRHVNHLSQQSRSIVELDRVWFGTRVKRRSGRDSLHYGQQLKVHLSLQTITVFVLVEQAEILSTLSFSL